MSSNTSTIERVRLYAFYLAVLAAIAVPVAMAGGLLPRVVTGWSGSFGTHSVHDLVIFAVVWMGLLGLVAQFYHTGNRVTAILAMPLIMIPTAVIGFVAGTEIAMMGVIFGGVSLVALVLHPAGRSLVRFDRVESVNRLLVGLFAVGAVAMLAYGAIELSKQFTLTNDHAAIQHYGSLAIAAFYVAFMGALAVFRKRDWRFAAWSAAFVALYIGASSVVFPAVESSLGLVGGALVVVWAVAFVGMTERVRGAAGEQRGSIDDPSARAN